MTRLHALLFATLALVPLAATASADGCAPACALEHKAKECLTAAPPELVNCLAALGALCVSFHIGGFYVGTPHLVDDRLQVAAYGFSFTAIVGRSVEWNPWDDRYGFGVFTIDFSTDARAC